MSGFVAYSGARTGRATTQASVWHALSHRVFYWLWIAALVSNIGTWTQNVGAAWLMTLSAESRLRRCVIDILIGDCCTTNPLIAWSALYQA
jgi:Transmembrane secretion effector